MKPKPLRKRDNRYWCAKYYAENKEKILEYHQKYYKANREEILKRVKIYDTKNKEQKRERNKKDYLRRKSKIIKQDNK